MTQTVAVQEDLDDSNNQEAPPAPLVRPRRLSNQQQQQQQTIAAAVAGDTADADRMVGYLKATGTLQEYQASVGCDVDYYNHHPDPPQTRMHWKPRNQPQHQPRLYSVAPPPRPGGGGGVVTGEAMAHCARQYIYERLRSSSPCNVCLLVAGMMPDDTDNDQTQQDKENNSDESSLSRRVRQQVTRALQQQQQQHGSLALSQTQQHRQDTLANHSTTPNVPP